MCCIFRTVSVCNPESQDESDDGGDTSPNTTELEEQEEKQSKRSSVVTKNDLARALVGFIQSRSDRDEDELFALSLAPALRRMDPAKKMHCKMAIMKVVNDYATESTMMTEQPGCHPGLQEDHQ